MELIEGHGAGGEREPGRMPPGSRTGLRDGRAAGRVPADPGRSGAGVADASPESSSRPGVPAADRTPVKVAVESADAAPGSPGYRRVRLPVCRARSCHHTE